MTKRVDARNRCLSGRMTVYTIKRWMDLQYIVMVLQCLIIPWPSGQPHHLWPYRYIPGLYHHEKGDTSPTVIHPAA